MAFLRPRSRSAVAAAVLLTLSAPLCLLLLLLLFPASSPFLPSRWLGTPGGALDFQEAHAVFEICPRTVPPQEREAFMADGYPRLRTRWEKRLGDEAVRSRVDKCSLEGAIGHLVILESPAITIVIVFPQISVFRRLRQTDPPTFLWRIPWWPTPAPASSWSSSSFSFGPGTRSASTWTKKLHKSSRTQSGAWWSAIGNFNFRPNLQSLVFP